MNVSEFKYVSVAAASTETLFEKSVDPAVSDPDLQLQSSILERVLICNTDTEDITVALKLDDGTDTFHILRTVTIPLGTTLDVLNGIPFVYDPRFRIQITTGTGHTCDVLASKK